MRDSNDGVSWTSILSLLLRRSVIGFGNGVVGIVSIIVTVDIFFF